MKPLRRVTFAEACAAKARADAYEEALKVARTFESKGANAGTLRIALQFLARDARDEANRCRLLEEAEVPREGDPRGGRARPSTASASSSGTHQPPERPPAVPLDPTYRLSYIAGSLDKAIATLETRPARRVFGEAAKSMAEYLRSLSTYALGQLHLPAEPVPEPQSIHVDHLERPRLRLVK